MTSYYSVSKKAFYSDELFDVGSMPEDVIEITEAQHLKMLEAINTNNKNIVVNKKGEISYVDRLPEPETWGTIKGKRNKLLAQTDYTQLADWPGEKSGWVVYRQALRDLTITFENPEDVIWPTPPGE